MGTLAAREIFTGVRTWPGSATRRARWAAAIIWLCCLLLAASCADAPRCDPAQHKSDPTNCNCKGACETGQLCSVGSCCMPSEHTTDPGNCGCRGPVPDGAMCSDGATCFVANHLSDRTNCGCMGACAAGDKCLMGVCTCNAAENMNNPLACGCVDVCTGAKTKCSSGKCVCDPFTTQDYSLDCGCNGPCAEQEACSGGRCLCLPGYVRCKEDEKCQLASTAYCLCDATKHISDAANCGCNGPCTAGLLCVASQCQCDASQHVSDADNCGCNGPCGIGNLCLAGHCKCDHVYHANDNELCGCVESCKFVDTGRICVSGSCVCPDGEQWCGAKCSPASCCEPSQHKSDADNCNCNGPCKKGYLCEPNASGVGDCTCDVNANLSNPKNCGCDKTVCAANEVCQGGKCVCKQGLYPCVKASGLTLCTPVPASQMCNDCGACAAGETCINGQCVCKPGFVPCQPMGGAAVCVPSGNLAYMCPDCTTLCTGGLTKCALTPGGTQKCNP